MKSRIVAALVVGAAGARRNLNHESVKVDLDDTLEEVEFDSNDASTVSRQRGPLGTCEVVSRRRAFETTCACRRRSSADAGDHGLECIDSSMRCPEGTTWNGASENCEGASSGGGSAGGGGGGPTTTPAPTRSPSEMVELVAPRPGAGDPANNPDGNVFLSCPGI